MLFLDRIDLNETFMFFLKKNGVAIFLVLCILSFVIWVLQTPVTQKSSLTGDSEAPLRVVASFYPLAEFARAVGGTNVHVETITPPGTEPHDYEPTAEQIAHIYNADVFLLNGGGIDAWATRIAADVSARGVQVIEMGKTLDVLGPPEGEEDPDVMYDPHFWLSPVLAQAEITTIENILKQKDVSNADAYMQNAKAFRLALSQLDQSYKEGLAFCQNKTVVASHSAFSYLAKEYGFDVLAISGLSPEEEPSAGRLAEIARLAKEKNIRHIYFETLASPKLSETLAREIGAETLVFNPLEGLSDEEQSDGKNYLSVMQDNLLNLKKGMVCR